MVAAMFSGVCGSVDGWPPILSDEPMTVPPFTPPPAKNTDCTRPQWSRPGSFDFAPSNVNTFGVRPNSPAITISTSSSIPRSDRSSSSADTARSVGEQVSEFAADVSRESGKQFGRAQDIAVDAYDEAHAAMRRNPLTAVLIALGVGFLFGVVSGRR